MTARDRHLRKVARDREAGYEGLLNAQDEKQRPLGKPGIRILEALSEQYEKSRNPAGLDGSMSMREYIELQKSGKLRELEKAARHIDEWLAEDELFNTAMDGHIEFYGPSEAKSFFNEAMRWLKSAQLIAEGPLKKTWIPMTTSPVHTFLKAIKAGERFTTESFAEYSGMSVSWAYNKLATTGKLGLTKQVKVRLHERL